MKSEENEIRTFDARSATGADNAELKALAAACPMRAAISICVHRNPDFFALNRLEGDRWNVSVVEGTSGSVVGCIAMAEHAIYLDGEACRSTYVSDLKVHPDYRGLGAADRLSHDAWKWCAGTEPGTPTLITVLKGNTAMERRIARGRGMPPCTALGTVRVYTVGLIRRRRIPHSDRYDISRARSGDLAEMAVLWKRVARAKQGARVFDPASLAAWIELAPGLDLSDYRVARDRGGRIVGFAAFWDQRCLKQLQVVSMTARGSLYRRSFNSLAPAFGAARLPPSGESLQCLSALHVCVPEDRADVLSSILITAQNEHRGRYPFLTIGLDVRDPLGAALKGFWAVPADVGVYLLSAHGGSRSTFRHDLPIHFETALV